MIDTISSLRSEIARLENRQQVSRAVLPFGLSEIDDRLAVGGLRVDALHEVAASGTDWGDDAAAMLFIAGIAARQPGPVLWIARQSQLFAPALFQAGLPPERVIHAESRNDNDLIAVMEDALRHKGLGTVIGEVRRANLTASRRLQLAAEAGTTLPLLIRGHIKRGYDPLAAPSAAVTRWRVGPAPSASVAHNDVARARWHVELVRQRGGEPFQLMVDACDETGRCALVAELVDRPDLARRAEPRAAA